MVEVRGTVHWLTHKDGPARALHVDPGGPGPAAAGARRHRAGRSGSPTPQGADALEIGSAMGELETVRLAGGLLGHVTGLAASPDGATVAAAAHDGRLLVVDVASGQVTELAASEDGAIERAVLVAGLGLAGLVPARHAGRWPGSGSPRIADGEVEMIDVTDGRFADTDPVFTPDGLYLAFLSRRSFDPVYDAQTFDLSFPFGSRPYLVPLAEQTPSPFGPLPGGRPVGQDPSAAEKDKSDSPERTEVSSTPKVSPAAWWASR